RRPTCCRASWFQAIRTATSLRCWPHRRATTSPRTRKRTTQLAGARSFRTRPCRSIRTGVMSRRTRAVLSSGGKPGSRRPRRRTCAFDMIGGMRCLFLAACLLLVSGVASPGEPIPALRFEGLWKLNGPDSFKPKLEFQVAGDSISATYYHPFPSALYDIQIEGDRFTAWYLDEFGSTVNLTAQLRGSELQLALAPEGRPPLIYSGA